MADYDTTPEDGYKSKLPPISPIVNDKKEVEKKPAFKLFPSLPKKEKQEDDEQPKSKGLNTGWAWVKDWSDLLILFPIMLIGFLSAKFWIVKVDPTAQVLDVANLVILNFNVMCLFFWSGVVFVLYKLYVGGNIFPQGWDEKLTPFQVMAIKLAVLFAMGAFAAFFLTRNL